MSNKETVSLQEASKILELTYATTYKIIVQQNRVPFYDYGDGKKKIIRICKKELEEFKQSKYVSAKLLKTFS